tara:strand:+ start:905 stop:1189 length:285 start_codon:yes stop_codon:yes gene_type:complete
MKKEDLMYDHMMTAPETQLSNSVKDVMKKWGDEVSALEILYVLDLMIFGSLASSFIVTTFQIFFNKAVEEEGSTVEAVIEKRDWNNYPRSKNGE